MTITTKWGDDNEGGMFELHRTVRISQQELHRLFEEGEITQPYDQFGAPNSRKIDGLTIVVDGRLK